MLVKSFLFLFIISFNAYAFNISSGISGSWYDRSNPGQGFNVEVLEGNHIVVYWYSYDQGEPLWLSGSGTYQGNVATVDLFYVQAGFFGADHQSNLVTRQAFGSTIFTFDNCNSGSMTYNSSIGFRSGSVKLDRLTTLSGLPCVENINPTPTPTLTPTNPTLRPLPTPRPTPTPTPRPTPTPDPVVPVIPFSNKVVEVGGIRWEPGACELIGTQLTCDFKAISLNGDVEIELLSTQGGTKINVAGELLLLQEVKLGNKISHSIFFGPKALLKKSIALNGHVIFELPAASIDVIDFLNISFELNEEVFDLEYFNAVVVNKN